MAMATSALVPCWNRPTTSRVSAGLRLSNVSPEVESTHSPAMKWGNVGVSTTVSVMRASVRLRSDPFDGHRDRTATAEAQRREPEPPLPADELVRQGRHDPRAAGADRGTERDRAAVDVDLRPIEPERTTVGKRLGGERLVDLDEVERLDRHLDPVEQAADAFDRRKEQPLRLDLRLGVADDPRERRQAETLDGTLAGDDGR